MFGSSESNIFGIILTSVVEHFKFIPDFLNLFFISMSLENVHSPFKVGSSICNLHRNIDCSEQF